MRKILVPICALALFAGCASVTDRAGTSVTMRHLDGSSMIFEANTRLKNDVQVTAVTYDKVPSGLHRVNIQLTSRVHRRLNLQYRIAWYNSEGMEIDGEQRPYRSLIIDGMDAVTVTGVANSPAAITSRLRLREARAADGYSD